MFVRFLEKSIDLSWCRLAVLVSQHASRESKSVLQTLDHVQLYDKLVTAQAR